MNMFDHNSLRNRVGPILSDGTAVRDLINLDTREVSLRVLNDPEIHELELQRIFGKSWVVVGHVAEIPKPGDYVRRYIGEDGVIVVRGQDGGVKILLNACSHRGMEVCRVDSGNDTQFKCPYHGWVFDTEGKLLGAPFEKQMYGDWDKSTKGFELLNAKVAIQSGIIFGNFDHDAPSLDDYLGDFKYYLDFTLGDDPDDLMVMGAFGGGQMARMGSNWKIMNDQFCGDHYHTATTHAVSMTDMWPDMDTGLAPLSAALGTSGGHVFWKTTYDVKTAQELEGGAFMRVVFPASGVGHGEVGGREGAAINMAMFVPRGPGDCEMHGLSIFRKSKMAGILGLQNAPKGRQVMRFGGPVSDIGADDNVQTYSIQRAVRGSITRRFVTMKYPAQNGPDARADGMVGPAKDWDPKTGYAHIGAPRDDNQWNWWRRYFDVMTADD